MRHIIGSARTIRTAVMVVEYLRARCAVECKLHPNQIHYRFKEPTEKNGFWAADIIADTVALDENAISTLVNTCRAFVAGAGELWA